MMKKVTDKIKGTPVFVQSNHLLSLNVGTSKALKQLLSIVVLTALSIAGFANGGIAQLVLRAKAQGSEFTTVEGLITPNTHFHSQAIQDEVIHPKYFDFDKNVALNLINSREQYIKISLPNVGNDGDDLVVELVAMPEAYYDFRITTSSGLKYTGRDLKLVHYRGVVRNYESESMVLLTVSDDEVSMSISIKDRAEYEIYKDRHENIHVFYNYLDIAPLHDESFACGSHGDYATSDLGSDDRTKKKKAAADKCLYLFIEAEYEAYEQLEKDLDQLQETILDMFHKTASLYKDIGVTIRLRELRLWDTPDPYTYNTNTNTGNGQTDMGAKVNDYEANASIPTDVHLVHFLSSFGAGSVLGLSGDFACFDAPGGPDPSIQFFTAWCSKGTNCFRSSVHTMAHEIGHSLGSPHTFACAWNGNCTPLENSGNSPGITCGGTYLNTCDSAPNPNDGINTVMSYGNLRYINSFGTQPGELIENFVNSQECLYACKVSCDDLQDIIDVGLWALHDVFSGFNDYRYSEIATNAYNEIYPGGEAAYYSAHAVYLKPDFIANSGSVLLAAINPCIYYAEKRKKPTALGLLEKGFVNDDFTIHAFPNPTTGKLVVALKEGSIDKLSVIDLMGKTIYEKQSVKAKRIELDLSGTAKGVYLLQAIDQTGHTETIKVIME